MKTALVRLLSIFLKAANPALTNTHMYRFRQRNDYFIKSFQTGIQQKFKPIAR